MAVRTALAIVVVMIVQLCLAFYGFARATEPPIGHADLETAVMKYLESRTPAFEVPLGSARIDLGVSDLERAGILNKASLFTANCQPRAHLFLTEEGQRVAADRGWEVAENFLVIPLGRLAYIRDATRIVQKPDGTQEATIHFRFKGNANAAYLRTLGSASHWNTGGIGLTDLGRMFSETFLAGPDHRWRLRSLPSLAVISQC